MPPSNTPSIAQCRCGGEARCYQGSFTERYSVLCIARPCLAQTSWFDTPAEAAAAWNAMCGTGREDVLRAALEDARRFVAVELEVRIDSHTLGGDMSTLDENDQGIVGEALCCLERIDAALSPAASSAPGSGDDATAGG